MQSQYPATKLYANRMLWFYYTTDIAFGRNLFLELQYVLINERELSCTEVIQKGLLLKTCAT